MVAILFCFVGIGTGIVALSTTAWQIPGVGLLESCTAILGIESCGFNLRKMIFFHKVITCYMSRVLKQGRIPHKRGISAFLRENWDHMRQSE